MDERMTLEMVRDGLRNNAADLKRNGWLSLLAGHLNKMADAIDAHLDQPAQAVDCPACEGRPASGNSPCHVCGKSAQAEGWSVPEAVRKGFMTSESCGPDKHYVLKIAFRSLDDLQAAHRAMLTPPTQATPNAHE